MQVGVEAGVSADFRQAAQWASKWLGDRAEVQPVVQKGVQGKEIGGRGPGGKGSAQASKYSSK